MDLDPKCIFVQRERNLDVHHPVINLVASLARNRGVTFTEIHTLMWQLINWQVNRGISKRGYIWVDNQPCNILDFKVAMVQLAFIFQVSTSVLEIRMRDLGIIKYQNKRRSAHSMFGDGRSVRSIGNIMNSWLDKYLDNADDLDVQDL